MIDQLRLIVPQANQRRDGTAEEDLASADEDSGSSGNSGDNITRPSDDDDSEDEERDTSGTLPSGSPEVHNICSSAM